MKTYHLIALLCLLGTACSPKEELPITDYVIVLWDKTDPDGSYMINKAKIRQMLTVNESEPFAGANVECAILTDLIYNPTFAASISSELESESNMLSRKKAIIDFNNRLDSNFTVAWQIKSGREHSAIFTPLSKALNELATKQGTKRLILLSDCHENSELFSVYKSDIKELEQAKAMESFIPLNQLLNGVVVYIIHQPVTVVDDTMFNKVSNALKEYLESKGAVVFIQTSIQ